MTATAGERVRMRGLMAAVIGMGVLIVLGVAILGVTIVRRLAAPVQVPQAFDEPLGTHMQSVASAGDRLAVLLTGGGPDRILFLDPRTGQVTGRVGLPQ